jgi:phage replication-related protein YjqB (UPF0714/DUF867 family)
MLQAIGRDVGHQVRITRLDNPGFVALYTVAEANPPADSGRANVVRTGLLGRERLGTSSEMAAEVHATVVDTVPPSSGVRFFEVAEDDGMQAHFIAIAPHGGDIEKHTDDQAEQFRSELLLNHVPASVWMCKGFGDELKGASDRWHITSTDVHPASFPLLKKIAARRFGHGVAFHGFSKRPDDADVYVGGGAADTLKCAIRCALQSAGLPLEIRIATESDDPKFQGRSADNLINRLSAQGIHLEQSGEARRFSREIVAAIAPVYMTCSLRESGL